MERRTFLKFMIVGSGGALLTWAGIENLDRILMEIDYWGMDTEKREAMSEIARFRASLLLTPIPFDELYGPSNIGSTWEGRYRFDNQMTGLLKNVGTRIEELTRLAMGRNSVKLVRGVRIDKENPQAAYFEVKTRKCVFGENFGYANKYELGDLICHEALGHGIRPIDNAYPLPMRIRVMHGKWRALSQAFSVPNQFFQNPKDLMHDRVYEYLGNTVKIWFVKNEGKMTRDNQDSLINDMLLKLFLDFDIEPQKAIFDSEFSIELGKRVLTAAFEKQFIFGRDLQLAYDTIMRGACDEIHAEMIKYSLKYPYLIGHNIDILGGTREVFEAISEGNVDWNGLYKELV